MNNTNSTWLTTKEAADYLRCSKPTLYRYIKKHNIITAKLIGKTLISKESINNVLLPA